MKLKLLVILLLTSVMAISGSNEGFKPNEVRDMSALCCSYTFLDIYGDDKAIIPKGYQRIYTSKVQGLDNLFQVYKGKGFGVINLRGSTAEMDSWLENFYADMIPAKGTITISGVEHQYKFAENDSAAVHSGYAYAIACLSKDLLQQIRVLNQQGIYQIYITGHSQGGALAQLLTAYLRYHDSVSDRNVFKTYAFASPMVGDVDFANEYAASYLGVSYNIINPADKIPKFPLSYNDSTLFTKDELISALFNPKSIDFSKKGFDSAVRMIDGLVNGTVKGISNKIYGQIDHGNDSLIMPKTVRKVNYAILSELIEIPPAEYPKTLRDSSILDNKEYMAKAPKDDNGDLLNDELYKKEPMFFQHKPYNYYVSVLKVYFPHEYDRLRMKVIPQNL